MQFDKNSTIDFTQRALREIEEHHAPVRDYFRQIGSARELAEKLGYTGNRFGHIDARNGMPDYGRLTSGQSLAEMCRAAEDAVSPVLKLSRQLAQAAESSVQAIAGTTLQHSAYARLAKPGLAGVGAMSGLVGQYKNSGESYKIFDAGLHRIGASIESRMVAANLARDQRDLIDYAQRHLSETRARAQWLGEMFAYTSHLEAFTQAFRQERLPSAHVFLLGEQLFGRFDETAHRTLELAQTATDRTQAYLTLGADARLLEMPRNILRRKFRVVERVTLVLVPKSSEPADQEDRIRRSDFVEDIPRLYERCRTLLAQLRRFVDVALTNVHGPSWVQDLLPRPLVAAWAKSAKEDGVTLTIGADWLAYADEDALVTLIASQWESAFACRIDDWSLFVDSIRVLGQLQRQVARMPKAMTKFDELRLAVVAADIAKILRPQLIR